MAFSVSIDASEIDRILDGSRRRQVLYARRAALLMRRYVPIREGILRSSEPTSSDYEAGLLVWDAPYAARQYYEPMRHAEAGTTDHWDQEMLKNDGDSLLRFAEGLFFE